MMAGLFRTQIQNNFRFKSLFSKTSLFIHSPTLSHQLFSLSSTRGMTNCIGTEGVKFTLTNCSRHVMCRHINALKENLTSGMLRDRASKQKQMLWEVTVCIFKMILSDTGCYYSGTVHAPKHQTKTCSYFHWQIIATGALEGTKQWNDKNIVTVWFPVKAKLNKNKTQISNLPLNNKKKAYFTIQSPVSIYSSAYLNKSLTNDEPSSGTIYSS